MKLRLLAIAAVTAGLLPLGHGDGGCQTAKSSLFTPSLYASEEGHGEHGGHGEKEKPAKAPDTLGGVWHAIKEKQSTLDQIIKDKKLDQVHKTAFAIRDLAKLLPDKSKDLSAENQKKLKDSVDRIAEIAKLLDQYGDANNQANTEAQDKRLDTLLDFVEKLYPADALKHEKKGGHDHHSSLEDQHMGQAYTCPMCAGVSSDKPGKCPKCGMDLVAKAAEPHSHDGHEAHGEKAHADHDAKHGGVFGMQGDYHYELVERDNEFRVYVYDAYTKPISVKGLTGAVEIEQQPGKPVSLPLSSAANDTYLATPIPKGADPVEVTLALDLPSEKLKITLPLRITLTGRVVDMACFAKDGAAALDRSHDECAKACIAAGSPVGILQGDDAKAPLYLVTLRGEGPGSKAANEKLLRFTNKQVHVTGRLIQRGKLKILEMTDVQTAE